MNFRQNDAKIFTVLRNHINGNKGDLIFHYNGVPFRELSSKPFFMVTDNRNQLNRISLSDGQPILHRGTLNINAHIPVTIEWSETEQIGYAGRINSIFQDGQIIRGYGLEIKIDNHPQLLGSAYMDDSGTRVNYPMAVSWQCFC